MSISSTYAGTWLGVVLLVVVAPAAGAQRASDRRGLWLQAGGGVGSTQATCSICLDRTTGPAVRAAVGGSMSRSILVGVEGTGWIKKGTPADRSFVMAAAVGTYYPWPDLGLHVRAGLGQYWYVEEDATSELSTQGLALEVAAGFDIRVARRFSLTPTGALIKSGFGNPTRLDKTTGLRLPLLSNMSVQALQLGLALTLH